MDIVFVALLAGGLMVANLIASLAVVRDEYSEKHQRRFQLLAIWLLPALGAILVLAIHRKSEEPSRQYRQPLDPGDDYAESGRAAKSIRSALDD